MIKDKKFKYIGFRNDLCDFIFLLFDKEFGLFCLTQTLEK